MLLLLFAGVECLVEVLSRHALYRSNSFLLSEANTVHYIQSEALFESALEGQPEDVACVTAIHIYRENPNDRSLGALVYEDEKSNAKNTFFFTASLAGKYYVIITPKSKGRRPSGLKLSMFSGEANQPAIVSTNDVEVSKAEFRIRKLLEHVKTNVNMQNLDCEEDSEYRRIYYDIIRKAIFVVLCKIAATVLALTYFNRKTKNYFSSQGVIDSSK
ncbi:hypothetical protein PAPHI01_0077 [Pancytospora philotis]|nr:hypothetical protein PAPHI01_0077 [Pancytospora philotis]